jgi:diguanylate cyclase (GGDEF)-like protein
MPAIVPTIPTVPGVPAVLTRNILCMAAAVAALFVLYACAGAAKPFATWHWMDIAGEGGTALMAAVWCLIVLASRPDGRVTRLLAGGLASIMLGSWADCLDEFYRIDKAALWDNALEALVPLGMLVLTAGLVYWRQEQERLSEHLRKRERLFRSHQPFDGVTGLAGAAYLRAQLRLEEGSGRCALVLLDIDAFHRINREHGRHEGDRVLQAVAQMLLLNLRNEDLLCRYAGDRFAVLMPGRDEAGAREAALHLCRMVGTMRHHAGPHAVPLSLRHDCAAARGAPEQLLADLCRRMDTA